MESAWTYGIESGSAVASENFLNMWLVSVALHNYGGFKPLNRHILKCFHIRHLFIHLQNTIARDLSLLP